ncbi:MAG: DUF5615 family PIN-like protein [Prevotella sp.]|jgi:predicted nuclease of predicted toxin-antitoxin system|nr:DUF5615 family PIN-like protein [Prevotella sp.]
MKLLFDQNISYRILKRLPDIFFENQQIRTADFENETDMNNWKCAKNNCFTIVTFDADFYEISLINVCLSLSF